MTVLIETEILKKVRRLPRQQQEEILNFTKFLETKIKEHPNADVSNHLPRLHRHKQQQEMLAETAVFEAHLNKLQQTHLNQYVAFHQGELVDHDADHHQLVQRINKRYPDETVLIRQITTENQHPIRLGSPRFTR